MTTVCATRTEMAADTLIVGATKTAGRKIWKVRGWIIGGGGSYSDVLRVIAEIRSRKDMTPKQILEKVDMRVKDAELLLLSPSGKIYHSEDAADPIEILEPWCAIGTGAQGAIVALMLGKTPRQAVRVMSDVDPSTGGRVLHYKVS